VCFCYSEFGRPSVKGPTNLDFNISHSGEYVLLGFIRDGRIGVDVEHIRPDIDWSAIQDLLPQSVRRQILREEEHLPSSYKAWTQYEALAKAIGQGITTAGDALFDKAHSAWLQLELPTVPDYELAAVTNVCIAAVRLFRWPESGVR
jgi:phosphopantetheinyl transferase